MTFEQAMKLPFGVNFAVGSRKYRHIQGSHYPRYEHDGIICLHVTEPGSPRAFNLYVRHEQINVVD